MVMASEDVLEASLAASEDARGLDGADQPGRILLPPKPLRIIRAPRYKRVLRHLAWLVPPVVFAVFVAPATVTFLTRRSPSDRRPEYSPCASFSGQGFGITFAFGTFTFYEAKIIDVGWNIVVGHGLQGLLGWIACRTFAIAMLRVIESSAVSHRLLAATSFEAGTIRSMPSLLKAVYACRGWRAKAIMGWMALATAYILALPALLDVVTGYVQETQESVTLRDQQIVKWADFRSAPDPYPEWFIVAGQNLTKAELWENGKARFPPFVCVPTLNYQWGFSSGWLFIILILTVVWSYGMYSLWVDGRKHSVLWRARRKPGLYRNVLDMAAALEHDLGSDTCAYSNDELAKAVARAGPIRFGVTHRKEEGVASMGFSSSRAQAPIMPSDMDGVTLYGASGG